MFAPNIQAVDPTYKYLPTFRARLCYHHNSAYSHLPKQHQYQPPKMETNAPGSSGDGAQLTIAAVSSSIVNRHLDKFLVDLIKT